MTAFSSQQSESEISRGEYECVMVGGQVARDGLMSANVLLPVVYMSSFIAKKLDIGSVARHRKGDGREHQNPQDSQLNPPAD